MKSMFETFLGVFFLVLAMVTGMSCISGAIDVRHADEAKVTYIQNIEDSNFSSRVMQQCFDSADKEGYKIDFVVYSDADGTNTVRNVHSKSEVGDISNAYLVRMTLDFNYSMPLMGIAAPHTLLGYAK